MTEYERIEKVIRHLDRHYASQPSLASLAKIAGLSESHFHRLFSKWAGTTPKTFLQVLTAGHARALLERSRDVLSTSLDAGLSGPGRLHDLMVSIDAMSPGEIKARGLGIEIRYGICPTPFGDGSIGITSRGVCHLEFSAGRSEETMIQELRSRWPNASFRPDQRAAARTTAAVFRRGGHSGLSVFLGGTPFQLKVWQALLKIPPGHVVSYGDLASHVGSPGAARAVGTAVASNSVGYLIPCHRVIRETGVIGEYRWGTERKKAILAWESA